MLKVSTIGASTSERDHATIDQIKTYFIESMDLVGPHGFANSVLFYWTYIHKLHVLYIISRTIFLDS